MSAARLRGVAGDVRKWVNEGVAQTIEVLVARRGVIVLHEVRGRLTPARDSPPTPLNAIFPVASFTKLFTGTALMTLVEEGRVGLNRPVFFYIPEFTGEGKDKVLVRHLLTHTSGLRGEDLDEYARQHEQEGEVTSSDPTIHPLVNKYYSMRYGAPLWKPPGSEMAYCNFNFDLAGEIVRRVAGVPLDRFAKSRIFQPLGMEDTHYCRVDADSKRRVGRPSSPIDPKNPLDPLSASIEAAIETERVCFGSGRGVSTALDFARFAQMFLNGGVYGHARVLSPVAVAQMTRNQIPGIGADWFGLTFPEASWGLGWSVHGHKASDGGLYSSESFEHWGSSGTYAWVDPELEIVGVYFSSTVSTSGVWDWLKYWSHDYFTDSVTAAVEEA